MKYIADYLKFQIYGYTVFIIHTLDNGHIPAASFTNRTTKLVLLPNRTEKEYVTGRMFILILKLRLNC